MSVTSQAAERPTRRRRWTAVAAAAGALWSVGYLALSLGWLAGVGANPADPAVDPAAELTLPGLLGPTAGAALLTVLSVVGLAVAVASFRLQRRADGAARAVGWAAVVLGLVLAVGMPDYRVLAVLGYAPIVLVMALAGRLPGATLLDWPSLNLFLLTAAGLVFVAMGIAGLVVTYRTHGRPAWTAPAAVARWGRWATGIAVAVPLGYAVTRYAWALGIPLGLSQESFADIREIAGIGAGLATGGVVGALLTWGLTRPWGSRFPTWLPGLGGRAVPIPLAVVPASVVAVAVTSAGLMFVRVAVTGRLADYFPVGVEDIAGWLPEMFWPVWGVALGAATLAYVLRRTQVAASARQTPGRTSPLS
ncbi:hypothetical protein [Georgenia deserti]|uniref:DUF3995 domain-containing protein n=1 Tax=Georgenia deserti TaxID=2093781 RepID=A0ABW4L6X6_9MICO